MSLDRTTFTLTAILPVILLIGFLIPNWATSLITIAFAKGLVVLGLMLLMRAGLVSFGQGLYYGLGAYAAGAVSHLAGINEALLLLLAAFFTSGLIAAILGILLAKYRNIFFAMLSLAFSMILYGLLIKTSLLGSSDGFSITGQHFLGYPLTGENRYPLFALTAVVTFIATISLHHYLKSPLGSLASAIKDNELRVEYLGASVRYAIHVKYVIAAALAGVGGALTAMTIGHIDPEMTNWTTSGEFVFVAILSGTGSVIAPFFGSLLFETLRSFAYEYSPNTWQLVLGSVMLLIIVFLPAGIWSIFQRRKAV